LVRRYDDFFRDPLFAAFVGHSGYANYGLWDDGARTGEEACDRLVDRLLGWVPATSGRVLDVACGQGGTTRRLLRSFPAERVAAINISKRQLDAAAGRTPGCALLVMDAARLGFADGSFDCILCVEAAFHFETRANFLAEAYRVLRPHGTLVFADIVARFGAGRVPRANLLRSIREYEELLRGVGFAGVEITDATRATWKAFTARYAAFARGRVAPLAALWRAPFLLWRYAVTDLAIRSYVLGCARKTATGSGAGSVAPARR
jgi:ubiquinone/menaquinone biosynthesis C-methylase UbiE